MVTVVLSALCFWICALIKNWWILHVYLLLAFIVLGIHTFILISQCCFSTSSSEALPDGLFPLFIYTARTSRLLHYLPSCFLWCSSPHGALHASQPIPMCPTLHSPPTRQQDCNPTRGTCRKTLKMPISPLGYRERLCSSLRLASEAKFRVAKDNFGAGKVTPEVSSLPRSNPRIVGEWGRGAERTPINSMQTLGPRSVTRWFLP